MGCLLNFTAANRQQNWFDLLNTYHTRTQRAVHFKVEIPSSINSYLCLTWTSCALIAASYSVMSALDRARIYEKTGLVTGPYPDFYKGRFVPWWPTGQISRPVAWRAETNVGSWGRAASPTSPIRRSRGALLPNRIRGRAPTAQRFYTTFGI